uniref:G2/mitotic-specific cyclin-B3 n=1 Tax=Ascaris suum TaxID=6253 RepID=F1KW10_ASCSU
MRLRNRDTNKVEASDGVKITNKVTGGHTKIEIARGGLRDASNAMHEQLGMIKGQGWKVVGKEPEPKRRRTAKTVDANCKAERSFLPERPQSPNENPCVLLCFLNTYCGQFRLTTVRKESVGINDNVTERPDLDEISSCLDYDFDAENTNDPNAVSMYAADIFKYYASREKKFRVGDYMKRQRGITKRSRAILADWLVEMQQHLELIHETLYLSTKLMDLFFDRVPNIATDQLQLIAASALLIASKFEERWPPLIEDLVDLCDGAFTRDDLRAMERKMLQAVGFDVGCPLSYSFLRRYSRVCKLDMKLLTLARYILETSLMFYEFVAVPESLMAAACLLLALRMNSSGDWNAILTKYSRYKLEDVEPLTWALNHMMVMRPKIYNTLTVIFDKYINPVFFNSAAVPPLKDVFTSDEPVGLPSSLGYIHQ